jgi:hypothetical protein
VGLKKPFFGMGAVEVTLPAGNADLVFRVNAEERYSGVRIRYNAQNVDIRYFFEEGKTYEVFFSTKRFGSLVTGVVKRGIYLKEKKQKLKDADFFEVRFKF